MEGKGLRGNGGLPPEVVRALFDRYDADASGELDYEEFVKMLRFSLTRNASMASFASFSSTDKPPEPSA